MSAPNLIQEIKINAMLEELAMNLVFLKVASFFGFKIRDELEATSENVLYIDKMKK